MVGREIENLRALSFDQKAENASAKNDETPETENKIRLQFGNL